MSLPRCTPILIGALICALSGCSSTTPGDAMSDASLESAGPLTAGVQRRELSNGLTVLVKENHASEVVAAVTYVKTGYFHETDEQTGLAHFIEHMFFNGTPTRPGAEDISRETKSLGGQLNAGTIYDRTSYYVVLPSKHWKNALEIQADAFQNPLFDAEVLEKEREAILQEARRKLDSPSALGREKMFELAFTKHRMRRWRIGEEEVLHALDRDDLARFYSDHYRPKNTILCVVGDVDTDEAFAEIERLYGGMDEGELRKRTGPAEPDQKEFRYRRMEGSVTQNYSFLGFHTPGVGHDDNAALEVLSTILGSGRSGRLHRRLVEDIGCATVASASCYQFEDVGIFEIDVTSSFLDLDRCTREIFVEIERLKNLGVLDAEIERARGILKTSQALGLEEVLGQAQILAGYEADGGYEKLDEEIRALNAVSADDVVRVAQKYLRLDNASLLEYVHFNHEDGRDAASLAANIQGYVLSQAPTLPEPELLMPADGLFAAEQIDQWSAAVSASDGATGEVQTFELPQGAKLIVKSVHEAPTVAISAFFRGGRIDESLNRAGMTRMMQRVMAKQSKNRSVEQLAAELEALGASIGRISTDDYFGFATGGLAENFVRMFDPFFDVISNPSFTQDQVEREREIQLSAISRIEDSPVATANQYLRAALFQQHPYGHTELGTLPVISNVDAPRLEDHYVECVRPEVLTITVVGDVDPAAVRDVVSAYVEAWKAEGEPLPATAAAFYDKSRVEVPPALVGNREATASQDRAQSSLFVAFRTVPRGHEDEIPLEVLANIAGGLGGTFFEEIRTKRGLAYSVSSYTVPKALAGYFATYVACTPDSLETVKKLVLELSDELASAAPDAGTVERSKAYVAGSHIVGMQRNAAQMAELAEQAVYGLDLAEVDRYVDRVRSVTVEDLQRVAESYLKERPHATGLVAGTSGRGANPN